MFDIDENFHKSVHDAYLTLNNGDIIEWQILVSPATYESVIEVMRDRPNFDVNKPMLVWGSEMIVDETIPDDKFDLI